MMFESLKIQEFRGIKSIEIKDFKRFNVFVGKNNACKTTVLESVFLLTGISNMSLSMNINVFRNYNILDETFWRLIFYKMDTTNDVQLSAALNQPNEFRKLLIKPLIENLAFDESARESLESDDKLRRKTLAFDMSVPPTGHSGVEIKVNGLISEIFISHKKSENPLRYVSEVRMKGDKPEYSMPKNYKEHIEGSFLCSSNINLDIARRFHKLVLEKKTGKIVKVLKQIEPNLRELSLGIDQRIYCDVGFDRLIPLSAMGDGMFRLMAIVLAILDSQNGVLLIDEVENGFHYSSQELLWKTIYEAATEYNVQIFVATHSLECVKAFSSVYNPQLFDGDNLRLFRLNRADEDIKVISYNYKEIASAIESGWEMR